MNDIKRIIVKKCIKFIQSILPWPRSHKVHIVFDGQVKFHYFHLESIVKQIIKDKRYRVSIIKWADFNSDDQIPGVTYKTFNQFWHDWFTIYDILLSTDLERRPSWFTDGIAICMFHGAGAKMSYFRKPEINDYNVIFSVGPMSYNVQKEFVNKTVAVEKIGLPISDFLIQNTKHPIPSSLQLDNTKPTMLYAPSWAYNAENVSMDDAILNELAKINHYNVIIRPHPNLLKPSSCNGYDWNISINKLKTKGVLISYSDDHSVYEILPHVDLLIGDISAVTFEYLVLNRPIILYMKESVLDAYEAPEFVKPMLSATTRLGSANMLPKILKNINTENDNHTKARNELLNNMLYNIGGATDCAVETIAKYAFKNIV